jgi:hypothetical protein
MPSDNVGDTGHRERGEPLRAPAQSWRDILLVHPAADLFPMMTDAEIVELAADIKQRGTLTSPVVISCEADNRRDLLNHFKPTSAETLAGLPTRRHGERVQKVVAPSLAYAVSATIGKRGALLLSKVMGLDPCHGPSPEIEGFLFLPPPLHRRAIQPGG